MDFSYGSISYKRRFSLSLSLDSYESTTLDKVISISSEYIYFNAGCTDLRHIVSVLYRDADFKTQLLKLDLHDYVISVLSVGDSKISF